jgi:hypothetical protein
VPDQIRFHVEILAADIACEELIALMDLGMILDLLFCRKCLLTDVAIKAFDCWISLEAE